MVRHTYGAAKGKYLIPGGFSELNELPEKTAEREVFEETGVRVKTKSLSTIRVTAKEVWCVFDAEYISGEPKSDLNLNSAKISVDEKSFENVYSIV